MSPTSYQAALPRDTHEARTERPDLIILNIFDTMSNEITDSSKKVSPAAHIQLQDILLVLLSNMPLRESLFYDTHT